MGEGEWKSPALAQPFTLIFSPWCKFIKSQVASTVAWKLTVELTFEICYQCNVDVLARHASDCRHAQGARALHW